MNVSSPTHSNAGALLERPEYIWSDTASGIPSSAIRDDLQVHAYDVIRRQGFHVAAVHNTQVRARFTADRILVSEPGGFEPNITRQLYPADLLDDINGTKLYNPKKIANVEVHANYRRSAYQQQTSHEGGGTILYFKQKEISSIFFFGLKDVIKSTARRERP